MSTILVTGGAGYIGSHVVKELLRQGHKPVVFDNLQTGHRKTTKDALFIEGDLSDQKKLKETFQAYQIDTVIHFAADSLVGESVQNPLKYFNNNVKNGLNLIEIMEEFKVKKIVFSSSAAVYGEPQEIHLIPLVIRAALDGTSVLVYGTDYNTPDGTCIRDYIHVTDLANAHILALKKLEQENFSGIYNMGNGNGYSVKEVIETVKKVTGRKVPAVDSPRRPGDPARLAASSEKIKKELGG